MTSTRQGLLNFGKRDRKLSRLQMYQKKYYKPKWKVVVERKWKEYQAQQNEDDETELKARIAFVNELCAKFLEDESEEVKKEIDGLTSARGGTLRSVVKSMFREVSSSCVPITK